MSEEHFPIDGSAPGDLKYEPVSALKQGPDAPAAAFLEDLQGALDNTPRLPIDPESQRIEEVRSGLLEYQRLHRTAPLPTHTLLDDRRRKIDVVLPRAETVIEVKYGTLEEAVLAQIKNGEMTKLDIDKTIFSQRKNIEGEGIVNHISVTRAIDSLLNKGLLQRNQNGTFSRTLKTISGGSDSSGRIKREDESMSKIETIKNTLANGAERVEDWLNKDREGVDPSGEAFLGQPSMDKPLLSPEFSPQNPEVPKEIKDEGNYGRYKKISNGLNMRLYTEAEVSESPAHKNFLTRLNRIIENTKDSIQKNKIKVFAEFKAAHRKCEDILMNLPSIEGFVPSDEYALLVRMAEQGAQEESASDRLPSSEGTTPEPPPVYMPRPAQITPPRLVEIKPSIVVEHPLITVGDVKEGGVVAPPPVVKEKNISHEVSYPEWLVPEPPPIVPEVVLPISAEDPTTLVKSFNERMSEAVVGAKPVLMSQTAVEELSTTRYEAPIGPQHKYAAEVDFGKLGEKYSHTKESLHDDLEKARQEFAKQTALYKQKINEGKKGYREIMERLGVPEKQRPLPPKTTEYEAAEKAHMEAKWNLKNFIAGIKIKKETPFNYVNSLIGPQAGETKIIDIGVVEQMEKEAYAFWRLVDAMSEKEKGSLRRKLDMGLEKWSTIPLPARMALTTGVFLGATFLASNIGVAAALGGATWRAGRALVGTGAALKAGKWFDGVKRKSLEKSHEERLGTFGDLTEDQGSFEESQKNLTSQIEKENQEIKDNRIKKGLVMAAVGGLATVGTGIAQSVITEALTTPGIKVNPEIEQVKPKVIPEKPTVMDKLLRQVPEKTMDAPTPKVYVDPVKVDLSSKGFIDTVRGLKEQLTGKTMSPKLAELMAQKPEKIAMDLGLYKPGQVAESAFGLQNEYLAVDAEGEISLVHSDGTTIDKLFDGEKATPYAGKMFDADNQAQSPMPTDAVEAPVAPKVGEVLPQTPKPVEEVMPNTSLMEIKSSVSPGDTVTDAAVTTPAFVEVKPRAPIDFDQTVVRSPEYTSPIDMASGKMPLKPEFQFDPKYKPERVAYNIQLEKALMSATPDMFDLRFPIEYNGGRINVFWKASDIPNIKDPTIKIFLNGQLIGTGDIIDGQPGLQYERSLGTSMFGVKSDFEKAFEVAQQGIMKNKMFFKKP